MKLLQVRTRELDEHSIKQYLDCFLASFGKPLARADFSAKFFGTSDSAGSYHVLALDGPTLAAAYSSIPFRYRVERASEVFALSVDTMVAPPYRGNPYALKRIAAAMYKWLRADGVILSFGFPNENIYAIRRKLFGWRDIARLTYCVVPLRMAFVSRLLSPVRLIEMGYMKAAHAFAPRGFARACLPDIELTEPWKPNYESSGVRAEYSIHREDNRAIVAYLRHIEPESNDDLSGFLAHVSTVHQADIAIYLTNQQGPRGFFRLPKKLEPKPIICAGLPLQDDDVRNSWLLDGKRWRLELRNFDAR